MNIQKLDFLLSLYILCIAISELMGGKTFYIGSIGNFTLNASVALFVVPLIYSINDILTEVYGRQRSRSIVQSGLVIIFFLMLFSLLATHLPASARFKPEEKSYDAIFGISARISASSLSAFAIGEFLDILIFSQIRKRLGSKRLWLRTNTANFLSQFLDTALFITLAFYSLNLSVPENISFLAGIILPYWLLKCFMSVIETPFVYLGVRWLKK